jgi:glycosyltransferase involved in cell wall biosynthesis
MASGICIYPGVTGPGGVGSFRLKFAAGLQRRGLHVTDDLEDPTCAAVLVLAGTRNLPGLWRARRRGLKIVQRLDGINWIHRRRQTSIRHYLRAEYGNRILSTIRSRLAQAVVYQSEFARRWWLEWYGPVPAPDRVVHNGVDLGVYTPEGLHDRPQDHCRLLVVEGSLGGGYDIGLANAVRLAETLAAEQGYPMELMIAGRVTPALQDGWERRSRVPLLWAGQVPRERIPELDRSAHLFFSADLNPACPNAVIEALACGLPVTAFDTGALRELVPAQAGAVVPYGGDPWRLDPPDIPALTAASAALLADSSAFREGARRHAESALGLDRMLDGYLEVLLG